MVKVLWDTWPVLKFNLGRFPKEMEQRGLEYPRNLPAGALLPSAMSVDSFNSPSEKKKMY